MIGLDTNVLVRLLVADDPVQTRQAQHFVGRHCSPESPGFINCVVLAELVWVLAGPYGYGRADIVGALERLLAGTDCVIEHSDAVRAAVADYKLGRADFADALIAAINRAGGCDSTATFDRKAAKGQGFVLVAGRRSGAD